MWHRPYERVRYRESKSRGWAQPTPGRRSRECRNRKIRNELDRISVFGTILPYVISQKLVRSKTRNHEYECCGARPEGAVLGGVDGLALGLAPVGPRFTWMSKWV